MDFRFTQLYQGFDAKINLRNLSKLLTQSHTPFRIKNDSDDSCFLIVNRWHGFLLFRKGACFDELVQNGDLEEKTSYIVGYICKIIDGNIRKYIDIKGLSSPL